MAMSDHRDLAKRRTNRSTVAIVVKEPSPTNLTEPGRHGGRPPTSARSLSTVLRGFNFSALAYNLASQQRSILAMRLVSLLLSAFAGSFNIRNAMALEIQVSTVARLGDVAYYIHQLPTSVWVSTRPSTDLRLIYSNWAGPQAECYRPGQ